jgi:nicotinic acid mononucleotide adenylyltransferase
MRLDMAGSATDPPHDLHAWVLQLILQAGSDLTIFYPTGASKFKPTMSQGIHRQQMAHLAFNQDWLCRPLPGWSKLFLDMSDTMNVEIPTAHRFEQLRRDYPGAEIRFVTGSDAVTPDAEGRLPITKWVEYEAKLSKETVLIVPRQGFALPNEIELPTHCQWLQTEPLPDVRSSTIRQLIRQGDNTEWRKVVNKNVQAYIDLHQLYRQTTDEMKGV